MGVLYTMDLHIIVVLTATTEVCLAISSTCPAGAVAVSPTYECDLGLNVKILQHPGYLVVTSFLFRWSSLNINKDQLLRPYLTFD